MKKDIAKTCILVCSVLVIALILLFIIGNIKYNVELLTRNKLIENDPTVKILFDRINGETVLRKAKLKTSDLTNEEKIIYIVENLNKDDYEVKKVKTLKNVCTINENISFNIEKGDCEILIVDNDIVMDYQNRLLGISDTLEYSEFSYHDKECKNDGTKYFCLLKKSNNSILGYSLFDGAYSEKDKVIINEYYLQIDVSNEKKCNKYFDRDYCENYLEREKPNLDEQRIKEDGVLYEHIFKDGNSSYYLEESFIVSEK